MNEVPKHIAIILDGNGRWAKKRNMPRTFGHAEGSKNVERICRAADELGVKYLTLYAFSTENWKRSADEVNELMRLLKSYLTDSKKRAKENNMRVKVIGDRKGLTPDLVSAIEDLEADSAAYTGLTLIIALNYGGRDEIIRCYKKLVYDGYDAEEITEELISGNLDTKGIPDPDLLIRTSGEQRLSGFLLWQLSYAELYFTDVLWPDFTKEDLIKAIDYYKNRDRRFGNAK
ncbi:MAG: isoprenyl transferase [Lachnospiraceae bacterium]|nr:isoprenyl transferase [Lachnospiraceae bacterium]